MNLSDYGMDTAKATVGSLVVSGRGVPRFSVLWNNPVGKASVAILVPFTDEVERWVKGITDNLQEGYVQPFEIVYEDEERTAQLVMSGEGEVYPHPFGRNGVVAIFVSSVSNFKREAVDLTATNQP